MVNELFEIAWTIPSVSPVWTLNLSLHQRYLVMPYGLTNVPVVFQTFMNEIFQELLNSFIIVYIDDILNYSSLNFMYTQCCNDSSNISLSQRLKSTWDTWETCILGYIISRQGVEMEYTKVKAVMEWWPKLTLAESNYDVDNRELIKEASLRKLWRNGDTGWRGLLTHFR